MDLIVLLLTISALIFLGTFVLLLIRLSLNLTFFKRKTMKKFLIKINEGKEDLLQYNNINKKENLFLLKNIKNEFLSRFGKEKNFYILNEIKKHPNKGHRRFVFNEIKEIITSFGYVGFNKGILILAALAQNKPHIKPTLLMNNEEIRKYFKIISNISSPLYERFVLSARHWLCGAIQMDEIGNIRILLIDPVGENVQLKKNIPRDRLTKKFIAICKRILPKASIFLAVDKKQHTYNGCSIFAVDDVIHLFSVENFLDRKKYPNGLFDFLKQHCQGKTKIKGMKVSISSLPLHLLRTMQSTQLLNMMQQSTEGLPLNKKGVTAQEFSQYKIGFFKKSSQHGEKLQNFRLEEKLEKMTYKTLHFLLHNEIPAIQIEAHNHTLEGFRKRLIR